MTRATSSGSSYTRSTAPSTRTASLSKASTDAGMRRSWNGRRFVRRAPISG